MESLDQPSIDDSSLSQKGLPMSAQFREKLARSQYQSRIRHRVWACEDEITSYSKHKSGWDGPDSVPIDVLTRLNAIDFVKAIGEKILLIDEDYIYPTGDGTIVIDFQNDLDDLVSVEVGINSIGFFMQTDKRISRIGEGLEAILSAIDFVWKRSRSKDLRNLVTIVIPCKNEGETIKKTLSLLSGQCHIDGTRIIIADSSNDNGFTRKMIESESKNGLKIEIVEGGLPSIARNRGSKGVMTKYILFIDADIFIEDKSLIYDIVNESKLCDLDLSTCKITTKDFYALAYSAFDFIRKIFLRNSPFAVGGFMLFNTKTFREIGEFDEDSKIAEDFQISKKIQPNKFRIFNRKVFTSSRRFKNKGLLYMIRIMIDCWLNQNDSKFYTRDYNYFK
jgi:hypothetical protein